MRVYAQRPARAAAIVELMVSLAATGSQPFWLALSGARAHDEVHAARSHEREIDAVVHVWPKQGRVSLGQTRKRSRETSSIDSRFARRLLHMTRRVRKIMFTPDTLPAGARRFLRAVHIPQHGCSHRASESSKCAHHAGERSAAWHGQTARGDQCARWSWIVIRGPRIGFRTPLTSISRMTRWRWPANGSSSSSIPSSSTGLPMSAMPTMAGRW